MTEDPRAQLEILRERRMKATGKETRKMTTYRILKEVPDVGTWEEMGNSQGANSLAAIRSFLERDGNGDKYGEGNYRGVPLTSWADEPHPIQRKISFG